VRSQKAGVRYPTKGVDGASAEGFSFCLKRRSGTLSLWLRHNLFLNFDFKKLNKNRKKIKETIKIALSKYNTTIKLTI
jgi:hypothetical protein